MSSTDAWSALRPVLVHMMAPVAASIATNWPFLRAESPNNVPLPSTGELMYMPTVSFFHA